MHSLTKPMQKSKKRQDVERNGNNGALNLSLDTKLDDDYSRICRDISLMPEHHEKAYSDEFLVDYGTPFAVDVRVGEDQALEFIPQKVPDCPSGFGLFPRRPSMPLLPPNDYVNLLKEPCMGDKARCAEALRRLLARFRYAKSSMKTDRYRFQMEELMTRLESLEDIDDEFKAREFHAMLQDFQFDRPKCVYKVANYTKSMDEKDLMELDVNCDYAGGCICYHSFDDNAIDNPAGVLIYPRGKSLDKLCFRQASFTQNDNFQLDDAQCVVDVPPDGRIFETKVATTQQQTFAICRQARHCSVLQLNCPNRISDGSVRLVASHEWPENDRPLSISINPYIASEFLVSTKNGSVYLWSPQSSHNSEPKLVYQGDNHDAIWTGCHFGGHPRLAVVASQSAVTLHDIGRAQLPSELLRLPHQSFHERERIMVMAKCFEPFYHVVALDTHVVVLDERKPNDPVLVWKPWFLSPPQYLDVLPGIFPAPSVDDLLIVGTQKSAETFCFQVHPARFGSKIPYPWQACGNYWRASRVDCFARFAARQGSGRYSTVTSSRLKAALAGICAVPHGTLGKQRGVSVVQITSFGDVFCQDYFVDEDERARNKTYSYGPGSVDVVLSEDDVHISVDWLNKARLQLTDTIAKDVEFYSDTINVSSIFQDVLPKCAPLSACCLCNRHWEKQTCSTVSDTDMCHSCNMTVLDSRAMYEAIKEGRVIPMPSDFSPRTAFESEELLRDFDAESFKDHESQLLLKLWNDDTDIEELLIKRDEELEKRLSVLRSQAAERQKQEKESKIAEEQRTDDGCEPEDITQEPEQELNATEEPEQEDNCDETGCDVPDSDLEFDKQYSQKHNKSNDCSEFNYDNSRNSFLGPCEQTQDATNLSMPQPEWLELDSSGSQLKRSADGEERLQDRPSSTPLKRCHSVASSTSSVHSVLLRSPGFHATPVRLRQFPTPSTGFTSPLASPPQRPRAVFQGPQLKRKQFGMGF